MLSRLYTTLIKSQLLQHKPMEANLSWSLQPGEQPIMHRAQLYPEVFKEKRLRWEARLKRLQRRAQDEATCV